VRLPGGKISDKSGQFFGVGRIRTPFGFFQVRAPIEKVLLINKKEFWLSRSCQIMDSHNNQCFTLSRLNPSTPLAIAKEYRIDSQDFLSPFLILSISVCLIEKFLSVDEDFENFDIHTEEEIQFKLSRFLSTS
jgi:hypothetical protein